MKRKLQRVLVASLVITVTGLIYLVWAAPASTSKLRLHLTAKNTSIKPNESIEPSITITNEANRPVTLVEPGDGSEVGWRTPVIKWRVTEISNDNKEGPSPESDEPIRQCGNINPWGLDEVFVLSPGKTKELREWIDHPSLRKPGVYKVAFSYENNPSVEWKGVPLGIHNPLAMLWARNSTKCELESNEMTIEVRE